MLGSEISPLWTHQVLNVLVDNVRIPNELLHELEKKRIPSQHLIKEENSPTRNES